MSRYTNHTTTVEDRLAEMMIKHMSEHGYKMLNVLRTIGAPTAEGLLGVILKQEKLAEEQMKGLEDTVDSLREELEDAEQDKQDAIDDAVQEKEDQIDELEEKVKKLEEENKKLKEANANWEADDANLTKVISMINELDEDYSVGGVDDLYGLVKELKEGVEGRYETYEHLHQFTNSILAIVGWEEADLVNVQREDEVINIFEEMKKKCDQLNIDNELPKTFK